MGCFALDRIPLAGTSSSQPSIIGVATLNRHQSDEGRGQEEEEPDGTRRQNRNASGWTLQVGRRARNTVTAKRRRRGTDEEMHRNNRTTGRGPRRRCTVVACGRRERDSASSFTRSQRSLPSYRTFRHSRRAISKFTVLLNASRVGVLEGHFTEGSGSLKFRGR